MSILTVGGVVKTVQLIGSNLPAFEALFDQVKATFSESDQEVLQEALDEAKRNSAQAQADFKEARAGR
jgi:hypothetical protein